MFNKSLLCLNIILFVTISTLLPDEVRIKNTVSKRSCIDTIDKIDELLSFMDQNAPTIIMGSMDACPHCQIIGPVFNDLSKKHKSIHFVKANGATTKMHDHVKNESARQGTGFKIIGYPAFVFIKNKKITNVIIGAMPEKLEEEIKIFLKS